MTRIAPAALVVGLSLVGGPGDAGAQPATRAPRVGQIWPGARSEPLASVDGLRQGLRELGYVEGQTIAIEGRWADGKPERLPDLAAELVRLKVDVIVVSGTSATRAAMQATTTIPIVSVSGDPVEAGLVTSLARPGGNVTGFTIIAQELSAKRLEILKEALPRLSRVALLALGPPVNPVVSGVGAVQSAAASLGLPVEVLGARGPDDFDVAFRTAVKRRAGAILVMPNAVFAEHRRALVSLAARHRLAAMYAGRPFVDVGGLMAYGPNIAELYRRRVASYVDRILKGARPADLPVEQPTTFELVVNLKTAKTLGLTIPQSILARADEVIQ